MVTVESVLAEAQKIIGAPVATTQPVVAATPASHFKKYLPYIIGIIIIGIIIYFISKRKK